MIHLVRRFFLSIGMAVLISFAPIFLGLAQAEDISQKGEHEIPVKLSASSRAATAESPVSKMFLALGFVGLLALGSVFIIKKMKLKQGARDHAPQIKMLTQMHIGPKKSLAIVRVAGESILIGISDHSINLIKALSLLDEEIPEIQEKDFKNLMPNLDEEVLGIQDQVSKRLKNMKELG